MFGFKILVNSRPVEFVVLGKYIPLLASRSEEAGVGRSAGGHEGAWREASSEGRSEVLKRGWGVNADRRDPRDPPLRFHVAFQVYGRLDRRARQPLANEP